MPTLLKEKYGTEDHEKIVELKEKATDSVKMAARGTGRVTMTEKECKSLCRKAGLEFHAGLEERVFQYTLTDETVDRYGDVVKAKGVDFKGSFAKNPVVMLFHNYHTFPVGKVIKIWKEANAVKGYVLVFDDQIDNTGTSETVHNLVKSGAMPAGSIGFIPKEVRRPEEKEADAMGMPRYGVIYDKSELLEFTLCPIPANPNALMNAMKSLKIDQLKMKGMFDSLTDSLEKYGEQIENKEGGFESGGLVVKGTEHETVIIGESSELVLPHDNREKVHVDLLDMYGTPDIVTKKDFEVMQENFNTLVTKINLLVTRMDSLIDVLDDQAVSVETTKDCGHTMRIDPESLENDIDQAKVLKDVVGKLTEITEHIKGENKDA